MGGSDQNSKPGDARYDYLGPTRPCGNHTLSPPHVSTEVDRAHEEDPHHHPVHHIQRCQVHRCFQQGTLLLRVLGPLSLTRQLRENSLTGSEGLVPAHLPPCDEALLLMVLNKGEGRNPFRDPPSVHDPFQGCLVSDLQYSAPVPQGHDHPITQVRPVPPSICKAPPVPAPSRSTGSKSPLGFKANVCYTGSHCVDRVASNSDLLASATMPRFKAKC